jgi:EmrB/QacA subfamily drug resistance transporter
MTQIIIFRAVQGLGAGILLANAFIVIGDLFPPSERGKYQGLTAGVFGIAAVIGPTLGGFITDTLSWNWVFFINIPLGILFLALFTIFLPDVRPFDLKRRVDYAGVITLVLTVVPMMLALSWAGVDYPWISAPIIGTFAFSVVMATLFVAIERRSEEPLVPLWIFRNRIVALSAVIIALTGMAMYGGIIYIPLFCQGVLGLSATTSGGFVTPLLIAVVVGSLASGQVLSRAGGHYRIQGIVGLTVMAAGVALLSSMTIETSHPTAIVYITIIGLGLGIIFPLYTIAVQNAVPYSVMGVATSSTTFFRSVGGALGLAIAGSVMNNRFPNDFINRLAPAAREAISPEPLNSLAYNPQALLSAEKQAELKEIYDGLGAGGEGLYDQMFQSLKLALESSLVDIFLIGLGIVILAWVVNWFIREIPLRKQH